MRQLVKITFINAADYDYFELKVDGDTAVYGINDGGKTTCARAVMYGEHGSINALNFGSTIISTRGTKTGSLFTITRMFEAMGSQFHTALS